MATMRFTLPGVGIDFSHSEVTQIISTMNSGASGAGALTQLLAAFGVTGTTTATAAGITGAVATLLKMGARWLNGCNSKRSGIHLFVYWVGVPWCRPQ
jgi:spore maturation protein SpmB